MYNVFFIQTMQNNDPRFNRLHKRSLYYFNFHMKPYSIYLIYMKVYFGTYVEFIIHQTHTSVPWIGQLWFNIYKLTFMHYFVVSFIPELKLINFIIIKNLTITMSK